ncbi:MAG: hypothetical protein ABR585_12495 [Gemmatimonadaceae bacterium]|nr:hypothetical protein [Actinomycetota bacterium]
MSAWASIADVQLYTGISVSQENIDASQAMVELFADCIYNQTVDTSGAPLIRAKNLRLLKMAVAYQAAWMSDHPDLFTHVDIGSMNQDGVFFVYKHENASLLAPMARRAIARLSWRRNKNIKVRPFAGRSILNKRYVQESMDGIEITPLSRWEQM